MKGRAIVFLVLVALFSVLIFPASSLCGAVDYYSGSRFSQSQSAVDSWPMFHHDLTHT